MKKLFFLYQDVMFNVGQFAGEYGKAGRFINETVNLVTLMTVKGLDIPLWSIPLFYIALLAVANYIGLWLIALKVPHYNNKLSNNVNPQILEMLEMLKRIEKHYEQRRTDNPNG